ncbi:DNA-directed RNA polymerase I subunit RPA12 [Heteronotia binoei]|uniref:DNA-directed RNA polymerase I subunit RPA12 n=1 Tax=Heteronotia binoei TaxID=13085 RepID=UPI00292E6BC0|nr:DNA-directed RNA polymerase I subunit RPA12 [Heteronotia binoei]
MLTRAGLLLDLEGKRHPISVVIMEQNTSHFQSEVDFCPDCGTVLPLPGIQDKVTCLCCSFSIDIMEFEGREIHTSIKFSTIDATSERKMDEANEIKGPLLDRNCPQCGHEGMVYHTRQMRSADEGQTVFYTCPSCRFQEKEDS